MKKQHRTPWIDVQLQVCFEEAEMELLVRGGYSGKSGTRREKVNVTTPVFRLPDGTEFSGRRLGGDLRERIVRAGKPKGAR